MAIKHADGSITLAREEWASVSALAYHGSYLEGEDTLGGLMQLGVFRVAPDKLCEVAELINEGNEDFYTLRQQAIDQAKTQLKSHQKRDNM